MKLNVLIGLWPQWLTTEFKLNSKPHGGNFPSLNWLATPNIYLDSAIKSIFSGCEGWPEFGCPAPQGPKFFPSACHCSPLAGDCEVDFLFCCKEQDSHDIWGARWDNGDTVYMLCGVGWQQPKVWAISPWVTDWLPVKNPWNCTISQHRIWD
jgi:hypothetical protein